MEVCNRSAPYFFLSQIVKQKFELWVNTSAVWETRVTLFSDLKIPFLTYQVKQHRAKGPKNNDNTFDDPLQKIISLRVFICVHWPDRLATLYSCRASDVTFIEGQWRVQPFFRSSILFYHEWQLYYFCSATGPSRSTSFLSGKHRSTDICDHLYRVAQTGTSWSFHLLRNLSLRYGNTNCYNTSVS